MILNEQTGSHDIYQGRKPKRVKQSKPKIGICPNGPLDEKLAWMRKRQEIKRQQQPVKRGKGNAA